MRNHEQANEHQADETQKGQGGHYSSRDWDASQAEADQKHQGQMNRFFDVELPSTAIDRGQSGQHLAR